VPEHDSSAFISYSREDSEFALRLAQDLKAAGAHVWLDQMDISPGVPWDNAIEDALNAAPQMLLVLSPSSSRSNNVRNEISFALEAGKVIIPVLYQDCIVPLRLQRNQRIDFRADYARGLTLLLSYLHVKNPDPEILEKAANGDAQRRTAWEAREAEAERLRERQQQEEEARLHEEAERHRQEQAERAAHEAEQQRIRESAAQQAAEEGNRRAEAARRAEEKRLADQAAAVPDPKPIPTETHAPTHVPPPPPRKPELPKAPVELRPPPILYDHGSGKSQATIAKKWEPSRIVVAALVVALIIAVVVIVAISNSHPSNATIVQGDGGSTSSGTQTETPPASQPAAPAASTVVTPPAAAPSPTKRSTAPNANAKQQFALSQSLGKQGNWVAAAKAGELALSLDPQSEDILQWVSFIDHEQLFKFERAYELDQMRIQLGYGQDDFVEANLTTSRFDACDNLAGAAWRNDTTTNLKIVMSSLQFACLTGERNFLASVMGSQLRKEISGLQKVGWTYNGTERFVASSPAFAPNGSTWVTLFQALTNGDERTALEALTALGISN